jgi:flagellar basal body-associated protein FliL
MLTKQDEDFIRYWSQQRMKKKQFLRKISIGLPLGVFLVAALMINFLSGWYQKADMELHSDSSVIIVVLLAAVAIVVFIVLFSARLKWDQNEQHYLELTKKKDETGPVQQVE